MLFSSKMLGFCRKLKKLRNMAKLPYKLAGNLSF
jgi:hypothetical protein